MAYRSSPVLGYLVATVMMALFVVANLFGVRYLVRANNAITTWKVIIPVLTIVVLLFTHFDTTNFTSHGFAPFGLHGILNAVSDGGAVFALVGFEQAVQLGGESRNPQRDMPRAVIFSMLIGATITMVSEGEMSDNNELPSLNILGSVSIASGFPRGIAQNSFAFGDDLTFVRGAHAVRLGDPLTRLQDNVNLVGLGSFVRFLSWPDFLLGLSASGDGTALSNVFASFDDFGLTAREYRAWEGSAFAQDDYRILRSLTLNAGLRYDRLGQFADRLGRNSSFDISLADPNPPPRGERRRVADRGLQLSRSSASGSCPLFQERVRK